MNSAVSHSMDIGKPADGVTHWTEAGGFVVVTLLFIVVSNLVVMLTDPDFGEE